MGRIDVIDKCLLKGREDLIRKPDPLHTGLCCLPEAWLKMWQEIFLPWFGNDEVPKNIQGK